MHKLMVVITHEYKEVVKKKSFLIGVLLTPIILFALIFLPTLLIDKESNDPIIFTLVDQGSGLLDGFKANFTGELEDGRPLFIVDYISVTPERLEPTRQDIIKQIESEDIPFCIFISENILESGYAERYAISHGKFADIATVKSVINKVVIKERLSDFDVPSEQIVALTKDVYVDFKQVGSEGEVSQGQGKSGMLSKYLSGIAFVMILFFSIIGYGQHLLRALMEEKNTRVIEVLISSLTPNQIMMGKIIGLGAASLTQLFLWMLIGLVVASLGAQSPMLAGMIANAESLSFSFFLSFTVYFILGYFIYATLFAMFGSVLSSEKDAQQVVGPINMLLLLPMMIGMLVLQDPNASWLVALSYFPLMTPSLMILRLSIATVPVIQIYTTVALLMVTLVVMVWLSARIFRVGILMYGKRPTLMEMIKWVRYK